MARFLFNVLPTRGHMYPALTVGYALRTAGHTVGFVTMPEFQHLLVPDEIDFFPLDEQAIHDAPAAALFERREEGGLREARKALKAAFEAFIAPVPRLAGRLQQLIATWQPDVLVNDPVSYAPLIAAELAGLPVATLNMSVFNWPGEGLGPFGLGLPPAHDAATRARYAALRISAEARFASVVDALNAVRTSFALPPRPGPLSAVTLSPYLQLLPTIAAIDYGRTDLPPQVHYVGPCLFDPPTEPDPQLATWLDGLPPSQPLVLVGASGAFTRSADLVEVAVEGLAEMGLAMLATLPFDHPLHQATLPPHTFVTRFVAHSQVLPRATAVVTHGGMGMTMKALAQGLPLVVVPFAADQPEVAQRVVAAGAGLRLNPMALTPKTIHGAVTSVLHESRYGAAAKRLAAVLGERDGPAEAARLLAHLAATRRPILGDVPLDGARALRRPIPRG